MALSKNTLILVLHSALVACGTFFALWAQSNYAIGWNVLGAVLVATGHRVVTLLVPASTVKAVEGLVLPKDGS